MRRIIYQWGNFYISSSLSPFKLPLSLSPRVAVKWGLNCSISSHDLTYKYVLFFPATFAAFVDCHFRRVVTFGTYILWHGSKCLRVSVNAKAVDSMNRLNIYRLCGIEFEVSRALEKAAIPYNVNTFWFIILLSLQSRWIVCDSFNENSTVYWES